MTIIPARFRTRGWPWRFDREAEVTPSPALGVALSQNATLPTNRIGPATGARSS